MYIKTKDGIYLVDEERETYFIKLSKNGFENYVPREKVIKIADSIEELCDMTIVVDDEKPNGVFELEWGIDKELISKYKDVEGVYVYGAIWTDKGLIYVAKMDENGELELI